MPTKTQLTGGSFQDTEGNPLAGGYLTMELSQDTQISTNVEICAGFVVLVGLDDNGDVRSDEGLIWANDVMTPTNTFYLVRAFSAEGQLVWGPNAQQVTGSSFDVGTWVPGIVNTNTNIVGIDLQTDSVNNGNQSKLNLVAGTNVTITDDGNGDITFAATGSGTSLTLETDGVANGSQILLNLVAGANVTVTDNGTGSVTIAASGSGGVSSFNTRTGAVTLSSGDVTTALGYTPPSSAVVSFNTRTGAVTLSSGDVTTALGYTPLATQNWTLSGSNIVNNNSGLVYIGGIFTTSSAAKTLVSGSGLQTFEVHGTNTTNNRAAFTFSGNFANAYESVAEFGTDLYENGATDFYVYSYPLANCILYSDATGRTAMNSLNTVPSAQLAVVSTTGGFLPPVITTTQKNAISSPAAGLVVYDNTLNKLCVFTGSAWETVTSV